jgi:hypothetical protein
MSGKVALGSLAPDDGAERVVDLDRGSKSDVSPART